MSTGPSIETTGRSITLVRDYPVAPERVFAAWTEPGELEWFSGLPAAQSEPSVDLRVGGYWRVLLQEGPGGRRYATGGRYLQIDAPHRLVFSWGAVGGWPELDPDDVDATPLVSLDFVATDDGTRMTARLSLSENLEPGQVEHWFGLGIRAGWTTTIDRLAAAVG
ncbi:SRPBCC domain-containing protein [Kineococcus sp. NBC_00420]